MWAHLVGQPLPETQSMTTKSRIAYFPQAWMSAEECHDDLLDTSYHDVPDGDPALIHELLHPWPARSVAGQLVDFIRRKRGFRKAPAVFVMDGANPALNPIAKRDDFV
jgi:hypothetical protein